MDTREIMEALFGEHTPYPGMAVQWQCFAGKDALESGSYEGKILQITWCQHCGVPSIFVEANGGGATFSVRISKDGRLVCGSEAPE
jgi:hypothetical protein